MAGKSERIVVLTGAGISHESGIPTFRGPGGLWRDVRAEDLATVRAFESDPVLVWEWYQWRRGICLNARPNEAHNAVVRLERARPEFLLVTQNVDGLHARSGSSKMIELHGSIWRGRCMACGARSDLLEHPLTALPPRCGCGGLIRPDVLWFGETYDMKMLGRAHARMNDCDLIIVVGTSGAVSVPAELVRSGRRTGAKVVEFNVERSEISTMTDQFIQGPAGENLPVFVDDLLRACG